MIRREIVLLMTLAVACLAGDSPYPRMASIDQYMMTRDAEIVLARSAAPESISRDAEILVLDRSGYKTVVKGTNGLVCVVFRSWTAGFDDAEFWNPKLRGPICFNPPAVRSYLPRSLKRTEWVLAGRSKEQIAESMKAAFDRNEFPVLEPGAMCYMMSRQGYLSDRDGHWHPHLMFYTPLTEPATWGAGLPGSPVIGYPDKNDRVTVFMVPVGKWSDGSAAAPMEEK